MFSSGIVIEWSYATEYVSLELESSNLPTIQVTREYWPSDKCFVKYNTTSTTIEFPGGRKLIIKYQHSNNPHIPVEDACWGVSEITIKDGEKDGTAKWIDDNDSGNNGTARWHCPNLGLFKDQKRFQTTKQRRQQDLFRKLLLSFDERCCLSGEETVAALEAAHIIPSEDLGAEVAENGILLRADLHKLLDRGCFRFDLEGNVIDVKDVSSDYRSLLEGAALPPGTLERVKSALQYMVKQ